MKPTIRHIETTFDPKTVDATAAELQANDEDWTYKVKHDPKGTGRSLIEVYDENGEFIHFM